MSCLDGLHVASELQLDRATHEMDSFPVHWNQSLGMMWIS